MFVLFVFNVIFNSQNVFVLIWFTGNVTFNNLSVISQSCLDVTGSAMLSFKVMPHEISRPDTWHDIPPVKLYWHQAYQF